MTIGAEMKRVLVMGRDVDHILPMVRERGFQVVRKDPEIVITWGGDGLLLRSEHAWPGVPKLPLRNSRHGIKCAPHEIPEALDGLLDGRFAPTSHLKVEAVVGDVTRTGLNDVIVHNAAPTSAVRYRIWIDGVELGHELVGDGVVVATPFGSTAYYRTITRGSFREGLGLAFNNSTEHVDHVVLPESAEIRIRVTRGPAALYADNQTDGHDLDVDDEVTVRRSPDRAVVLTELPG
ncbi:MAG: hypothetical protein HKN12_10825 [Gemmatimonadetes bacterium]|nr:hypothetical protein [Gemmatimonadota bacterium]